MYSPADRPSSTRAAPAKNRSWSTIGGISSLAVSARGLPVLRHSASRSSSVRASIASAILSSARWRSAGVVSRQPSNASAAAVMARSTSAATGDRSRGEHLAGARVDQVRVPAVGRLDVRPIHEVAQDLLVAHGCPTSRLPTLHAILATDSVVGKPPVNEFRAPTRWPHFPTLRRRGPVTLTTSPTGGRDGDRVRRRWPGRRRRSRWPRTGWRRGARVPGTTPRRSCRRPRCRRGGRRTSRIGPRP